MEFASDNAAGVSERVLEAIRTANPGAAAAYGTDEHTQRAIRLLCDIFERECAVFLVTTGTAANALALASLTPPWGAVLCHADAHVLSDECGAPEMFSAGAKIIGIPGDAGKITPDALKEALARYATGAVHQVQPAALSLSQASESGTVYSCAEIARLAEIAHAAGLGVHMDGARFANAFVGQNGTAAEMTWKAGVDVLCFGATKNGALACEAVIFFDPAKAADFAFRRKRSGQTLSKGRFLGAQMVGHLEDGHWLDLARHANGCASALARGLAAIPGVTIHWPMQANEVFAVLPTNTHAALKAAGAHYYEWPDSELTTGQVLVRLVCSFATQSHEVERFLDVARGVG